MIVLVKVNHLSNEVGKRYSQVHDSNVHQNLSGSAAELLEAHVGEQDE